MYAFANVVKQLRLFPKLPIVSLFMFVDKKH